MLTVGDFAEGCTTASQHFAHLTGTQTNRHLMTFTSHQLNGSTRTACQLTTFTWLHLNTVNGATNRDIAQRQAVTRLHARIVAGHQLVADLDLVRRDDVATLT